MFAGLTGLLRDVLSPFYKEEDGKNGKSFLF